MHQLLRTGALLVASFLIPACGGGGGGGAAPSGISSGTAVGLSGNILVFFSPSAPQSLAGLLPVSGLAPGENLVGIDFRPADGRLYACAVSGTSFQLYAVDVNSGVATTLPFGTFVHTAGTRYGIDFNPVVDRLRVVNSAEENLRANPTTGARADSPTNDTDLNPVSQDVSGIAYSNNFTGTAMTTLYGIASGTSQLVTIGGLNSVPSPNLGQVTAVGGLTVTVDAGSGVGFDITANGTAYASLQVGGVTRLYTINLGTGIATVVGPIGPGSIVLQGLTIVP